MRIGLIGINRYAKFLNFACNLHAYAFQQFLLEHGYESTFLDYKPVYYGKNFDMKYPVVDAEAKYRRVLLRDPQTKAGAAQKEKDLLKWAELAMGYRSAIEERERRYEKFESFISRNLEFTDEKYDSDLLEISTPDFDTYICVTDVIWQPLQRYGFDRGFMLGSKAFEGKYKIAYAPSRGASGDFTASQETDFFDYLSDIDDISVREQDFKEYIESKSDSTATLVADPTLLHGKEFWQCVSTKPREQGYVLLYYVMEQATDTIQKAVDYAKLHNLTVVELSDRPFRHGKVTDPDVRHVSRYDVGLEEWLGYIENAECVFTNSFHGCCFSLLFETPFFAGPRNGQKVPNFLSMFGLESQRFGRETSVDDMSLDVDFAAAREVLEKERVLSREFLLSALKKAESRVATDDSEALVRFEARRRRLEYPALFHSGFEGQVKGVSKSATSRDVEVKVHGEGRFEYLKPGFRYVNDGNSRIALGNLFRAPGYKFAGWTLRFRIDNRWFWYLDDGTIAPGGIRVTKLEKRKAVFSEDSVIPHLPVNHISVAVFTARWEEKKPTLRNQFMLALRKPHKVPGAVVRKVRRILNLG